jgi:ABC-2 type transport system ATP-binding protein
MDEAHALADRLAVLVDGRIVARGTPDEVIGRHAQDVAIRVRLAAHAQPPARLGLAPDPDRSGWWSAHVRDPRGLLLALTTWARDTETPFEDIAVARPSLEDVYLALTGHRADAPDR